MSRATEYAPVQVGDTAAKLSRLQGDRRQLARLRTEAGISHNDGIVVTVDHQEFLVPEVIARALGHR